MHAKFQWDWLKKLPDFIPLKQASILFRSHCTHLLKRRGTHPCTPICSPPAWPHYPSCRTWDSAFRTLSCCWTLSKIHRCLAVHLRCSYLLKKSMHVKRKWKKVTIKCFFVEKDHVQSSFLPLTTADSAPTYMYIVQYSTCTVHTPAFFLVFS